MRIIFRPSVGKRRGEEVVSASDAYRCAGSRPRIDVDDNPFSLIVVHDLKTKTSSRSRQTEYKSDVRLSKNASTVISGRQQISCIRRPLFPPSGKRIKSSAIIVVAPRLPCPQRGLTKYSCSPKGLSGGAKRGVGISLNFKSSNNASLSAHSIAEDFLGIRRS